MSMNRVIGVIAATGCAALLAGGCATTSTPSSGASPTSSGSAAASTTPKSRAAADAASILQSFVPPKGASRLTAAPSADNGALKRPATAIASPDLVDDVSWWKVPGSPQTVLAWEKAHLPSSFRWSGSGSSFTVGHAPTSWSEQWSLASVSGVLDERQLAVEAVNDGSGQTALRVDAQVDWVPAKLASERVPASARVVTIAASSGTVKEKTPAPVTITNAATVAKIASLVDGLPVSSPGERSCPLDLGKAVQMTFRATAKGSPLAVVTADSGGCQNVNFTVGGKAQPALSNGGTAARQVLAAAGLHWTGYTGTGTPGGATNPGGPNGTIGPSGAPGGGKANPGGGSANPGGGSVNPGGPMQG